MIAHSKAPNGEELITMEIELHRFVLPEFNTHRTFSRNFQSSRAVPVQKMIEQVRNDPAMPVHWGKNQRGMVAEEQLENVEHIQRRWRLAAISAADEAEYLVSQGLHKQVSNRLLEPFMWTKGVATATRTAFEAFFLLRSHKDAQPEIKALSDAMKVVLEESVPRKLECGEYHLPYVDLEDPLFTIEEAVKISSSCCAQVSYRSLDDSIEKAEKIYNMLNLPENGVYKEDPPHFSPTEHIAKVVMCTTTDRCSGSFHSREFWQYRKALEIGLEGKFLEIK